MIPAEKQAMLDRYFTTGDNADEMLIYLAEHWGNKSKGIAKKYFGIISSARENGIKVYGIDEPNEVFITSSFNQRLERSNPYWKSIIVNNVTPYDKYIVYGGAGHAANYPMNKGVDYMLGIPIIKLETGSSKILQGNGKSSDFIVNLKKSIEQPENIFDD